LTFLFCILAVTPAHAYIGPGAGFAFLSSFLVLFATFVLAFFALISWPLRWMFRAIRGKGAYRSSRVRRVVIMGLDGLDPYLVNTYMEAGKLPNLARLKEEGTFRALRTTYPAISPVAWSSFQTGANPGKHNIFDFLARDRKTYLPDLSSAHIGGPKRRFKLGKLSIPVGKPEIRLLRKSKPFWTVLGEHGVFSTVLRVPITFPPEKFRGLMLSAMCVPDLKGSQGTFSFYSTRDGEGTKHTGGTQIPVDRDGDTVASYLSGPENPFRDDSSELRVPFTAALDVKKNSAVVALQGKKIALHVGEYSDWIGVKFKAGPGVSVGGICRFYLKEVAPEFELYVTPINIDPAKPALPISHPFTYAVYLSKLLGPYATLGLAEDTWALTEEVLDDEPFLRQCWEIHDEREKMFFSALERTSRGLCVCVFDTTDRIQHTFWRYLEPDHPANRDKTLMDGPNPIEHLYETMDAMVGKALGKLGKDDLFIVMSDHGFKSFRRGVNLNSWLYENGYMALKNGDESGEWFKDVDWSRTKAYALGLGGVYINMKGRESQGIVEPGDETESLKAELIEKLSGLKDPEEGKTAINEVFDSAKLYTGPYRGDAPDLLVGYNIGYRASWDGVTGIVNRTVIEDNTKAWSGDHCIDPRLVPGCLFCNRPIDADSPSIMDVGPTVLDLFNVPVPGYMEGKPLFAKDEDSG